MSKRFPNSTPLPTVVIETVFRSNKKQLRVTTGGVDGRPLVSVREWYLDESAEKNSDSEVWLPGRNGIALQPEELHEVIVGLKQARDAMKAK